MFVRAMRAILVPLLATVVAGQYSACPKQWKYVNGEWKLGCRDAVATPAYAKPAYAKPVYPRPVYTSPTYPSPTYPRPTYPRPTYPRPTYPTKPTYPKKPAKKQKYPKPAAVCPRSDAPGGGLWAQCGPVKRKCTAGAIENPEETDRAGCQAFAQGQGLDFFQFDSQQCRCAAVATCGKGLWEKTKAPWQIFAAGECVDSGRAGNLHAGYPRAEPEPEPEPEIIVGLPEPTIPAPRTPVCNDDPSWAFTSKSSRMKVYTITCAFLAAKKVTAPARNYYCTQGTSAKQTAPGPCKGAASTCEGKAKPWDASVPCAATCGTCGNDYDDYENEPEPEPEPEPQPEPEPEPEPPTFPPTEPPTYPPTEPPTSYPPTTEPPSPYPPTTEPPEYLAQTAEPTRGTRNYGQRPPAYGGCSACGSFCVFAGLIPGWCSANLACHASPYPPACGRGGAPSYPVRTPQPTNPPTDDPTADPTAPPVAPTYPPTEPPTTEPPTSESPSYPELVPGGWTELFADHTKTVEGQHFVGVRCQCVRKGGINGGGFNNNLCPKTAVTTILPHVFGTLQSSEVDAKQQCMAMAKQKGHTIIEFNLENNKCATMSPDKCAYPTKTGKCRKTGCTSDPGEGCCNPPKDDGGWRVYEAPEEPEPYPTHEPTSPPKPRYQPPAYYPRPPWRPAPRPPYRPQPVYPAPRPVYHTPKPVSYPRPTPQYPRPVFYTPRPVPQYPKPVSYPAPKPYTNPTPVYTKPTYPTPAKPYTPKPLPAYKPPVYPTPKPWKPPAGPKPVYYPAPQFTKTNPYQKTSYSRPEPEPYSRPEPEPYSRPEPEPYR